MGERTRLRTGTNEGVKTVRVYSANPKTVDGDLKFKEDSEVISLLRPYCVEKIVPLSLRQIFSWNRNRTMGTWRL